MKSKLFIFGSLAALLATESQAATATKGATGTDLSSTASGVWSGGGGTNGAPNTADVATWNGSSTTGALTVGSAVTWLAVDFTAPVAASTTITGSKITLTRNVGDATAAILNDSGELVTINNELAFTSLLRNTITSNITSSVSSGLTLGGTITSSGTSLFVRGTSTSVNNRIDGAITAISLTKTDTGAWSLTNANTITNGIAFGNGTLRVGHNTALGAGTVTITNGGTLTTSTLGAVSGLGDRTLANNFTIGGITGNTLAVDTANANIRLDGNITDSGALSLKLTKTGANTLTLAGTASNYSGGTTVSGGNLTVASAGALGSGAVLVNGANTGVVPSLTVNDGLTVANALTLKRGLSGDGRANIVIGAGANWSGNITLDNTTATGFAALLTSSAATAPATASIVSGNIGFSTLGTPSSSSPTLVLRGGQFGKVSGNMSLSTTGYLQITDGSKWEISGTSNSWGTLDIANEFATVTVGAANTLSSTGVVVSNSTNGGTLRLNNQAGTTAFNQTIAGLSGKVKVGLATGAATLTLDTTTDQSSSGVISGAISLDKKGAAVQTLSGANTHTGSTTITAGNLTLSNALALQNSALVTTGAGTVTLSGHTNPTFGGLSGATGNLASVITNYNTVTALTLNPNAGSVSYGGVIANGSGATTLTKTGGGTQVLSGTNSYTGITTVSAGTLVINGDQSSATGAVTVSNSGSRLMGSGTVGGATTINTGAIHSAGDSGVGKQTFSSSLTYGSGSVFEWDLNANAETGRGTAYDAVDVVTLNVDPGAIFKVVLGSGVTADPFWTNPAVTRTWSDIFNYTTLVGSFNTADIVVTGPGAANTGMGSFSITGTSLTWTAVPEPSSALAGLLIAAGLIRRRR